MPGYIRTYPIGQGNASNPGPGIGGGGVGGGGGELKGEFQEYGCLSLPVSCMSLNHDGSLLFVGGEDGVLAMYCVAEDPKAAEKKVSNAINELTYVYFSFEGVRCMSLAFDRRQNANGSVCVGG